MKRENHSLNDNVLIKEVNELNEFDKLKVEWDELAQKQGRYAPFFYFDWFKVWLKHFFDGNHLLILLLCEREEIVGIAPFWVTRGKFNSLPVSKIELIGNVYSPVRGFLFGESDIITKTKYLHNIFEYLLKNSKKWDIIDLGPIPEEDENRLIIKSIINKMNYRSCEEKYDVNWCIDKIDYSSDEYFKRRGKNIRYELKRRRKRLEELGELRFEVIKDDNELNKYIELYYDVYGKSWKKKEDVGPTFHRDLATATADKGWLRLAFLFLNDVPIASQFRIVFKDICYFLKTAYDDEYKKYGAGSILLAEVIKYLIDTERVKNIDFGPGDELYKTNWASGKREMKRIIVFNKTSKGNCLAVLNNNILPTIRKNRTLNRIKNYLVKQARHYF